MRRLWTMLLYLSPALGITAEPSAAEIELLVTPGWREAALTVPPLSLLRDPAAAATVSHVHDQLTALDGTLVTASGLPPLVPLVSHLDGLVFRCAQRNSPHFDWFQDGSVLAVDCGVAAAGLGRWLDGMFVMGGGQRIHWEGFVGYAMDPGLFIGQGGARFVFGQFERLPEPIRMLAELAVPPADPRISLIWRLGPRFTDLELAGGPATVALDELLGAWRGARPSAEVRIVAGPTGWSGEVAVSDLPRLPLGVLDGEVAAVARTGRSLTVGLHVDPPSVMRVLHAMSPDLVEQEVEAVAAQLTGDGLVQAGWSAGPLPQGAVLLRLHDGGEAAHALAALAARLGAKVVERGGSDQAFELITPVGATLIARRGDRLVIGTDEGLLTPWLAGTPGDMPLAGGCVLQLELDLPAIARQWLPWAWAALADVREPLGDSPTAEVNELLWELRGTLRRIAAPVSISDALAHGDPQGLAGRDPLRRLFPGPDLGQVLDTACALYVPDPAVPPDEEGMPLARLVLHFTDGFAIFEDDGHQAGLDAAALGAQLQGWKRLLGPEPAALVRLPAPEPTVFDRRWLPPLAVALGHVPAYRLEITSADFSLRISERGLPLASLAIIAAALGLLD